MAFILDGYCGLYCGARPNLLHTKAGTGTERCYGRKSKKQARTKRIIVLIY